MGRGLALDLSSGRSLIQQLVALGFFRLLLAMSFSGRWELMVACRRR